MCFTVFILRTNVWLWGMFCTKNAYPVGGGALVSLQEQGHRTSASLTASAPGSQSLFGLGLQADFFFFFFQTKP